MAQSEINIKDQISNVFAVLGKRERSVARVLLREYPVSALATVARLAETSGVSTATVLRLTGKLGFAGYGDFQSAVKRDLRYHLQSPSDRMTINQSVIPKPKPDDLPSRMAAQFTQNIKQSFHAIIAVDFDEAIELLSEKQKAIYCIGGRYSTHVAEVFSQYMAVLRKNVYFVSGQNEGWARYLAFIDKKSTIVVFDIRRYQHSVQQFAKLASKRGAKIILVTDSWADASELPANLQFHQASASVSPLDSLVGQFAFMETLLAGFVESNEKQAHIRLSAFDDLNNALAMSPNKGDHYDKNDC